MVIFEASTEKAIDPWSKEMTDLAVIDRGVPYQAHMELYQKFRAVSVALISLFLPN